MANDYRDICIRWQGHPKYKVDKVVEDEIIEVIVQKLEMILFTNKGENYGNAAMGCDLEQYLWETNVPAALIQEHIETQISQFVPELNAIGYVLTIDMLMGPERDQMYLNFTISGYNVVFSFV